MNTETLKNINKIIERDNKTSTYKFALLRGVIDIIQSNSPYIKVESDKAILPMGLLIENWIIYYYPILENRIPQIYGRNNKLQFEGLLNELIELYKQNGGLSKLVEDLRSKGIPAMYESFTALVRSMRSTIANMPMRYIGKSIYNQEYAIFKPNNDTKKLSKINDTISLVQYAGTFTIPLDYFEALKVFGSFISGQNTLLHKWAEFSFEASGRSFDKVMVRDQLSPYIVEVRNITESKRIYAEHLKKHNYLYCVWTGKKTKQYEIDHLLPFSVWKNNDLWNLLPADIKINGQKSDKIPTPN